MSVEYQFNGESVSKDVWKVRETGNRRGPGSWSDYSPQNPVGFAHELLRAMEGEKPQFQFRENGDQWLYFDLSGGAPVVRVVREVLGKCNAPFE